MISLRATARTLIAAALLCIGALSVNAPVAAAGIQVWSNNAQTTLATPITSGATSLSVLSGSGSQFPALSGGNWFIATLQHIVSGAVTAQEIVKVTVHAGDTMTIVRAQENTSALTWSAGDSFALLPTAGGLSQFIQPTQLQAQAPNYTNDTGSANAYSVVLTPALTAHVNGAPIRWFAAHSNTGASTFNDGAGIAALSVGGVLIGGEIIIGRIYTVFYDGTVFQLENPSNYETQSAAAATYAPLNSATLTGLPTVPTASFGTSTAQIASTAFVQAALAAAQTAVGQTVATQLGGTSGIGSGYTSITFNMPVVAGASYALTFDSDATTSGVGTLSSRIAVTGGSGSITPVATGLCFDISGTGHLGWFQTNPAGMTGITITNNATPHEHYTGEFNVSAGVTSVAYQLAVTSGTLSVPAGGAVSLLRIN